MIILVVGVATVDLEREGFGRGGVQHKRHLRPAKHRREVEREGFGMPQEQKGHSPIDVLYRKSSILLDKEGEKDYNDNHREEITDFVQSIPGFQECDEDIET
ncbi:hypothetical protein TNCV_3412761 [Trichonephila clavipes]|uniref:Uncharacterized protein n=1 Tax=Trichonephila clavipes TaxID=2585209 RepID=A0A8X6UZS7_TRICX|nr:hypothetical protein TNCV_3412761 [Trichonephila clavipes]